MNSYSLQAKQRIAWILASAFFLQAWPAQARGPIRASEENTRGWNFMTPEERITHQAKIRGFNTYEECKAYRQEQHRRIDERARATGRTPPGGERDFCAHLLEGAVK
jgi:hypothetical protein